jgi:cytochrome c553
MKRITLALLILGTASAALAADPPTRFSAAQLEHFEKAIRPLLVKRCFSCHSDRAKKLKAGLKLDTRQRALTGGDTGAALVPGSPDKSLLVQAIRYDGDYKMPPAGKLPPEEIRLLTEWVRGGAAWPAGGDSRAAGPDARFDLQTRRKAHWAWQQVRVVPPVDLPEGTAAEVAAWPTSMIDRYILEKLVAEKLAPAGDAQRTTWLRRITYDLTGLPSTPGELDAFLGDKTAGAFERVADRLLASKRFGEHWARHWLDLVRFAESRGHESDFVTPNAWEYRDYVIRALNADVPYDLFVVEHIAGDLLPRPRRHPEQGFGESVLGTGFWFLGEWCHSPVDIRQDESDRHDNMLDVFGKTFLGLTIGCARCHEHKFDAISQEDYYALTGYLRSSGFRLVRYETIDHNRKVARQLAKFRRQAHYRLLEAVLAGVTPGLVDFPAYLLAAHGVIAKAKTGDGEALIAAANARKLDVSRLKRLIVHLAAAEKNPDDLLHAWALLSRKAVQPTPAAVGAVLDPLRKAWTARRSAAAAAVGNARVLVDFNALSGRRWRQDGASFRTGPVRPGDLVTTQNPARPIASVRTRGGAAWDAAFSGLTLTGGTENENGRLSGWVRGGRTFRTPTFALKTGRLWYLVAGGGHSFASVDSHRLLHGPLHGETVHAWDAGNSRPRWVGHNLSRFAGHRIHLEFSPRGDKPLELYQVVESDRPPADPFGADMIEALASRLDAKHVTTIDQAAAATAAMMKAAIAWSEEPAPTQATAQSAVLDWLVRHVSLMAANPRASEARVARACEALIAGEKRLKAQVKKSSRLAMAMWDGSAENEQLFIRGSHRRRGKTIPRRLLTALGGQVTKATEPGSGRLGLAVSMVDSKNPLVARVMVNRLWHHLFGRGLVATVDNFGVQGGRPSHPKLLDWLADRFVRNRWKIKSMIRLMVLSRTYRMSSQAGREALAADPANNWLHSMRMRRVSGEAIRDAMLKISGRLDSAYLGKSVPVYLSEHMIGRGRPKSGPMDGKGRRTIYIGVRRNFLSPLMLAFDTPQPFSTVGRRTRSNVPAQALILMNDPFVISQSKAWARRLLDRKGLDTSERINVAYREAFGHRPDDKERAVARGFLLEQGRRYGLTDDRGETDPKTWSDLCHVMFNAKEFIFIN